MTPAAHGDYRRIFISALKPRNRFPLACNRILGGRSKKFDGVRRLLENIVLKTVVWTGYYFVYGVFE
jgi:hypothetical protein